MNRQRLAAQLLQDEGRRLTVYRDTRGFLTVGIGHLVRAADGLQFGDGISPARCQALFETDLARVLQDCTQLVADFDGLPDDVQEILANMRFNLGLRGLQGFHTLLGAIAQRDWPHAARAMQHSLWATQVGARAARLIARMQAQDAVPPEGA
jgi:lysozyme